MLPTFINEQQQAEKAMAIAEQLQGLPISQALHILKEITPGIITRAHTVTPTVITAAKERLQTDGSY